MRAGSKKTSRNTVPNLARELLPLARKFAGGKYGIALGGAHAKGAEDSQSDLDIYVFAKSFPGNEERSALARGFDSRISRVVSWGAAGPFEQAGTDFYCGDTKVECWLRNLKFIECAIKECRDGRIQKDFTVWTPMGFYNYCTLSDLHVMKTLDDSKGMLKRWQAQVREYPPKLRSAIMGQFLQAARFWPRNFHYESAVERRDVIYCTGIAQQVIHHLIQVLFALNRVYFPGDKKLAEALNHLPRLPQNLVGRLEGILLPGRAPAVADLRHQRTMLQDLFDDVERMVRKHAR